MNIKLIQSLCKMNQQQLLKVMTEYLRSKGYKIKRTKQFVTAEGREPIALIAHLDTVFEIPPTEIFHDPEAKVLWSPQGAGFDDKAGVYAIIQILERGLRPHIIFTTDEEKGCLGANALVKKFKKCPFKNIKCIIQIDRRGSEDCVFYDCDNQDFVSYIESFGFKEDIGSYTDISIIGPAWKIVAVNVSCGYYYEHTYSEMLRYNELELTIDRVINIINVADAMPEFESRMIKHMYPLMIQTEANECLFCGKKLNDDCRRVEEGDYVYAVCDDCYEYYYNSYYYDDIRLS